MKGSYTKESIMNVKCCEEQAAQKPIPEVGQCFLGRMKSNLLSLKSETVGVFILSKHVNSPTATYPVHLATGLMVNRENVEVIKLLPNATVSC
jgi:hypothetical protein